MRKLARETKILDIVEASMPDATHEEKLQANFDCWQFFDAIWAIAGRLVSEQEAERAAARDKSAPFANVETTPNA